MNFGCNIDSLLCKTQIVHWGVRTFICSSSNKYDDWSIENINNVFNVCIIFQQTCNYGRQLSTLSGISIIPLFRRDTLTWSLNGTQQVTWCRRPLYLSANFSDNPVHRSLFQLFCQDDKVEENSGILMSCKFRGTLLQLRRGHEFVFWNRYGRNKIKDIYQTCRLVQDLKGSLGIDHIAMATQVDWLLLVLIIKLILLNPKQESSNAKK